MAMWPRGQRMYGVYIDAQDVRYAVISITAACYGISSADIRGHSWMYVSRIFLRVFI